MMTTMDKQWWYSRRDSHRPRTHHRQYYSSSSRMYDSCPELQEEHLFLETDSQLAATTTTTVPGTRY